MWLTNAHRQPFYAIAQSDFKEKPLSGVCDIDSQLGSRLKQKTGGRKTSGKPRVPFSALQLMLLEQRYSHARYLSKSDVSELSSRLRLPEHRVKIWFQNRRSRERRNTNPDSPAEHDGTVGCRPNVDAHPAPFYCPLLSSCSGLDVVTGVHRAPGIFPSSAVQAGFARSFLSPYPLLSPHFVRVRDCLHSPTPRACSTRPGQVYENPSGDRTYGTFFSI